MAGLKSRRESKSTTPNLRALVSGLILAVAIIVTLLPITVPRTQAHTPVDGVDALLRLADLLAQPSMDRMDVALCDYYEAGRLYLDEYANYIDVRGLAIELDKAVLTIKPAEENINETGLGVLIEKMASGGLLCSRNEISTGITLDTVDGYLRLRLEGGRYELVLPPLEGLSIEIRASDSIVRGKLVDAGSLRLELDSSMAGITHEINGIYWRGLHARVKDSFTSLVISGTINGIAPVNVESFSSVVLLEPLVGWVCVSDTTIKDSLVKANYPSCDEIVGYTSKYAQLNITAHDSMVVISD